jgi:hypothetical protein
MPTKMLADGVGQVRTHVGDLEVGGHVAAAEAGDGPAEGPAHLGPARLAGPERPEQADGPLRPGLGKADAGTTYSVLASLATFDFLTRQQGWTRDQFEAWLAEALIRLLPDPARR